MLWTQCGVKRGNGKWVRVASKLQRSCGFPHVSVVKTMQSRANSGVA